MYGLMFTPSTTTDLIAFTNADWEGCLDDRRSMSELPYFFGKNVIFG